MGDLLLHQNVGPDFVIDNLKQDKIYVHIFSAAGALFSKNKPVYVLLKLNIIPDKLRGRGLVSNRKRNTRIIFGVIFLKMHKGGHIFSAADAYLQTKYSKNMIRLPLTNFQTHSLRGPQLLHWGATTSHALATKTRPTQREDWTGGCNCTASRALDCRGNCFRKQMSTIRIV